MIEKDLAQNVLDSSDQIAQYVVDQIVGLNNKLNSLRVNENRLLNLMEFFKILGKI